MGFMMALKDEILLLICQLGQKHTVSFTVPCAPLPPTPILVSRERFIRLHRSPKSFGHPRPPRFSVQITRLEQRILPNSRVVASESGGKSPWNVGLPDWPAPCNGNTAVKENIIIIPANRDQDPPYQPDLPARQVPETIRPRKTDDAVEHAAN